MRRRTSVAAVFAAAAVAVTAAPASASTGAATLTGTGQLSQQRGAPAAATSPFLYSISNRACLSNGLRFTAQQKEVGRSGTQRFRQLAQVQHRVGTRWVASTGVGSALSPRFPNDAQTHTFTRTWTGTYGSADRGRLVRIVWKGQWLNGAGAVIANSPVVVAVQCQA